MSKQEFLAQLREGLCGLPCEDIEERLTFYSEMIDDRMEEGLSEEKAVSAVGSVQEIVQQAVGDIPFAKIAKERIKPKRHLKGWEIVLLVLGSPIWLSLAVAAVTVILSLYAVLWSGIIALWAVFVSTICCSLAGVVIGVISACHGMASAGVAIIGAGLFCAGFSVFMFYGCKSATKGILMLTKKLAIWIKSCFIKKEEVQ